ncbi:hypothetical protein [Marinimicrobium sp. ABcell2]|uniref:hypothetical protein n=1 Tax=Marinimicrobium sp. ABcell2 TaxID=3069751 RepID=UPI0027AE0929|nr:hypothetical protein [Marinimicrobium sp. ABcell2]MDQ2076826.1 hypothetical protein [Marinimicrobium sp. ABcell2]
MNKMLMQFQRELWESRASILRTPLILGGILVALLLVGMFTTQQNVQELTGGKWAEVNVEGDASEFLALLFSGDLFQVHPRILTAGLAAIHTMFVLVLLLVIPSYLLGSLYTDRRDQSILFWKSLPMSETQSVLTKLGTALLLAPGIYILAALATGVIYLLLLFLYGAIALGVPLPGIGAVLSALVSSAFEMVLAWTLLALWLLPLFSWLLLASAVAKKAPFLWAIGLPLGAVILERWVLGSSYLGGAIAGQIGAGVMAFVAAIQGPSELTNQLGNGLVSPALFGGLAVCAMFVLASIWLRNNRYEI